MKKLLLLTFRQSLEHDLGNLLHELGVKNYTLISGIKGKGQTGTATGSFSSPGLNSMLLVVLEEEQTPPIFEKLKAFHNRLVTQQPSKIPLRMFVLPCDQII